MDWELKASAWDFTELGREELVGSSGLGFHKSGGGFSVDLKLGGLGDGSVEKLREQRGSAIASSPSGASRRGRAISGHQNASCLVDGCTADLSSCREYHRRHRVCERHSKTPVVIVGGKEQRFCQQCSRFQSLAEFDEEKRSCRKRLDGHNRRRRKPQPEALYMSSWSFLSDPQGTRFLHFGDSQAYASNPAAGSGATWSRFAKNQQDMRVANEQFRIPSCTYNGGDKQFPFLLVDDSDRSNQAVLNVPICQRHVSLDTSPERGRTQKMLSDGLEPVDSKCALSLLSSHPMQSSETSFSLLPRDVIYPNQLIGTALHFDSLSQYPRSQGVEEKPAELPPHVSSLSSGIFQVAPDDLLEKGASQVLPFSWK